MATDYAAIQADEIQALQAIYGDAFHLSTGEKAAWSKKADAAFSIHLPSLTLHVRLPATYPKSLPLLHLHVPDHLSHHLRTELHEIVRDKPKELLGAEMIYDLVTALQDVLDQVSKSKPVLTLEQERLAQLQAAQLQADQRKRQNEEQQEAHRQHLEASMLAELSKLSHERQKQHTQPNVPLDVPGVVYFDRASPPVHSPTGLKLDIRAVYQKILFRRSKTASLFLVQPWPEIDQPVFLLLKETVVPPSQDVHQLEDLLDRLLHQPPHESINPLLNHKLERRVTTWYLQNLVSFAHKGSMTDLLANSGAVPLSTWKSWIIQLLEGLHHIRQTGNIHAGIHLHNILLFSGDAHTIVKWDNAGLSRPSTRPSGWSSSNDIWCFGICALQMAFGLNVIHEHESPSSAMRALNLSPSMHHFCNAIFSLETASPWSLLHFDFLRNADPFQNVLREDLPQSDSEYTRKFVEEGRLGRGGFGEVYKARNRVDGQLYAIKKVRQIELDVLLSETTVLSKLNHPHVVRYFTSWVERSGSVGNLPNASYNSFDIVFAHSSSDDDSNSSSEDNDRETVLYIQMEYCVQQTLRNLIVRGLQEAEMWRLFQQIVLGLAHIHAASIVHRDLKPENIFIDNKTDVRIGDFGLARPGDIRAAQTGSSTPGSLTTGVGSACYIAPEVRPGQSGSYDGKADMYSLGIIFVEMNLLFSTAMERVQALSTPLPLPPSLGDLQSQIAEKLLQQSPHHRPSAVALLEIIPAQENDEMDRKLRRELADPTSRMRKVFLTSIFAPQIVEHTFADKLRILDSTQETPLVQTRVKQELIRIFQRHGAVERAEPPAIMSCQPLYATADVVRFLDNRGNMCQLVHDLILPHALQLARCPSVLKSFAFGNVGRPQQALVSFDLADIEEAGFVLKEAEILRVVEEIIETFPQLTKVSYQINHSAILEAVLNFCQIESAKHDEVKEIMGKSYAWSRIRHELRAIAVSSANLEMLETFDFREPLPRAISRLQSLLRRTSELNGVFDHLQEIVRWCELMSVKTPIYLCPISSLNERFYRGQMFFQCLHKGSVIASGGRYDSLVQEYRPARVHVVGFQLSWTGMALDVKETRCEVGVEGNDQSLVVAMLRELWEHGVGAEIARPNRRGPEYRWSVRIKTADSIKVKREGRLEEVDLRPSELVSWIRSPQERRPLVRQDSKAEEVQVLLPGKKSVKKGLVEEALSQVQAWRNGSRPIIAVDMKEEVLQQLSRPESWKSIASTADRRYLGQLQELIQDQGEVILYNSRTRSVIIR